MAGPAIETLLRVLRDKGPGILRSPYYEKYATPPGLRDRLQAAAGAWRTSEKDPHVGGRALDIILRAERPWEQRVANDLIDAFLLLRTTMNWGGIVYNEWEWNSAGVRTARSLVCDPALTDSQEVSDKKKANRPICMHYSHIHIEWGPVGISTTGFEGALSAAVAKITDPTEYLLVGQWDAKIGNWTGTFEFSDEDFAAKWTDSTSSTPHRGRWSIAGSAAEWKFNDDAAQKLIPRTFHVPLPLTSRVHGDILPTGQGFFEMTKRG